MASPFKGIHAPAVEIFPEKGTGREGKGREGKKRGGKGRGREEKGRGGGGREGRDFYILVRHIAKQKYPIIRMRCNALRWSVV